MFELQYLVVRAQSKASKTRSGMISQPFPCFFTGMRLSFLREKAVSHIKKARCGMKLNMIEHHCHCGKCGVFTMCFHHVFSIQTWAWTSLNHLWKNSHQGGPCTDYMIRTSNGTHKTMGDLAKQKGGCGQQSCYVQLDWFVVLVQLYKNYSALDIIQEKGMIVAPSRIERSNQCPFFVCSTLKHGRQTTSHGSGPARSIKRSIQFCWHGFDQDGGRFTCFDLF